MSMKYTCEYCGSDNITQNADVEPDTGEVVNYFDEFTCGDCNRQSKSCNTEEVLDPLKKFSVLLLYPDYIASSFGESYYAIVEAISPEEAVTAAQNEAADAQTDGENDDRPDPDDFACILVIAGDHPDINPGT
jgi:hypothetical protein